MNHNVTTFHLGVLPRPCVHECKTIRVQGSGRSRRILCSKLSWPSCTQRTLPHTRLGWCYYKLAAVQAAGSSVKQQPAAFADHPTLRRISSKGCKGRAEGRNWPATSPSRVSPQCTQLPAVGCAAATAASLSCLHASTCKPAASGTQNRHMAHPQASSMPRRHRIHQQCQPKTTMTRPLTLPTSVLAVRLLAGQKKQGNTHVCRWFYAPVTHPPF